MTTRRTTKCICNSWFNGNLIGLCRWIKEHSKTRRCYYVVWEGKLTLAESTEHSNSSTNNQCWHTSGFATLSRTQLNSFMAQIRVFRTESENCVRYMLSVCRYPLLSPSRGYPSCQDGLHIHHRKRATTVAIRLHKCIRLLRYLDWPLAKSGLKIHPVRPEPSAFQ